MSSRTTPVEPPAWRGWIRTAVAALGLATLVAGGGLRQDELACEEAVAHLKACCPDFQGARLECVYSDGCSRVDPALSVDESACIVARTCEDIVASELCARTKDLESPHEDEDGGFVAHPPVCP